MGIVHKTGITFELLVESIAFASTPIPSSKVPNTKHPIIWKVRPEPKPKTDNQRQPYRRRKQGYNTGLRMSAMSASGISLQ